MRAPCCWVLLLVGPALLSACDDVCLHADGCQVTAPCRRLPYPRCEDKDTLQLRVLQGGDRPAGPDAIGARGDVLLGNGKAVAVIADIGNQNYLDPNGGSLLDLGVPGKDNDNINQVLPVVGILPRDSVHYTRRQLIDERPRRVAVVLRGTLFQLPGVPVMTIYEARPCEPGIRVRTEIANGTPDPQLWALSDGFYWSLREELPFTPGPGFEHPGFTLLSINDAFRRSPLLAASTHGGPAASYALFGCNQDLLEGFHSEGVSTLGLPRTVVPRGEYLVYERFLAVAPRGDVAGAADLAEQARAQLYGDSLFTLSGKVDRGGLPIASERETSLLIVENAARAAGDAPSESPPRPQVTQVVPDTNGAFSAQVPAGKAYVVEVHSFGRKVLEQPVPPLTANQDLGVLRIPAASRVSVSVISRDDGKPIEAEVFLLPADAATQTSVKGTLHGQFDACAPWLGPPHGGSPACNRLLVARGVTPVVEVPAGRYHFYAYHGPYYTIDRQTLDLMPGEQEVYLNLRHLLLQPPGTLSADLHVHGAASFDSSIPEEDRVLSFATADVDVIVATDHDVVHDYGPVLKALGLEDRMSALSGVETTGHIPYLYAPDISVPLVIGHYNFWPLRYRPELPRAGGPFDEFVEPGELFDRVEPLYSGLPLIELNHPWADPIFGRDLGFPRAIGMNLLRPLPAQDDGTAGGLYVRSPRGRHRNNDQHAQEVMNGSNNQFFLAYRAFWFYLLNQGQLVAGTANSDSHGLTDNTLGSPRNVVYTDTHAGPAFDVNVFNQAIRDGNVLGTNGPIIEASIEGKDGQAVRYSVRPFTPRDGALLRLSVSAPPWTPVDEVRIIVNGRLVRTLAGKDLKHPADPFGTLGLLRYQGQFPLADLLPPTGDAWLVIEAGYPLPPAADLGGAPHNEPDGVPDTGDNNGDGKVDRDDIAPGKDYGPLKDPDPPRDESDPRYHFAQVVPGGYPLAFTNPFVIDRDGNGKFDAPGLGGGWTP